jgi:NADP-reducing hydrogenase subunit HndB
MAKLKISDLAKIKDRVHQDTSLREGGAQVKITVHMGTCGIASGARAILNSMMDALGETERSDIIITTSGCAGLCSHEPMITVELLGEEPIKYAKLDEAKARQIFMRHALEGEVQTEWALAKGTE